MNKFSSYKFLLTFCFIVLSAVVFAQVKSTNIQTIEGKKFYIHKIEKSQSLYAISKLYATTVEELYKYNPDLRSGAKANQEIKVPVVSAAPVATGPATVNLGQVPAIDTTKYLTHKVAKGETTYSLTRKFNISEKELINFNPSLAQGIKEGQVIIVGEKGKKKPLSVVTKELKQIFTAKEKPVSLIPDTMMNRPVSKPKKNAYNISLILPFQLNKSLALDVNELAKTNSNFPEIPALAVDFYLGFKRAVDSLRAPDFDLHLQLHDLDDKDTVKLASIVSNSDFKETDIIFGPLYANGFKRISVKAKEFAIPIVSPITTQNKILYNNYYISKTNPSQFTWMESLADYCIDSLVKNNANIILMTLNDKDKKEAGYVTAFKKYYNEKQKALGKGPADTVTLARGINGAKARYKPNVRNVIISLSTHQVFFTDFATQLAIFAEKKDIVLCGFQSITEMDNIDQAYLNQLHYTFPHQYNITNLASFNVLTDEYKKLQGTTPSEYFYIGFDIAYYYLKNLKETGPDFVHKLDSYPLETNYMRFKFNRPDNSTGFDNRGVYIFKYDDFHIINTGWK